MNTEMKMISRSNRSPLAAFWLLAGLLCLVVVGYGQPQYIPPRGGTGGGATIPSTANVIKGDGSGNGADTKVAVTSPTTAATLSFPTDNATITFQGTDTYIGRATTDTLTNKTLTAPTISSFANATHNHTNSAGGGTLTLAGAAFANQGTTTTLLHGSASGNPSFGAVDLTADVTGVLPGTNGGTGVNNSTRTMTYAGNVAFTGAFNPTFAIPSSSTWTFPSGGGTLLISGGALGTPSGATLTNATGLPISTGVSGLGTGVATFLTTPSSANLAAAVTDETGTGLLVFATSPVFTTPNIGAATGTSLTTSADIKSNGGIVQGTNGVNVGFARALAFSNGTNFTNTGLSRSADGLVDVSETSGCGTSTNCRDIRARYFVSIVGGSVSSASTIAPTARLFHVTGTTTIDTVTAPTDMALTNTGGCIVLVPDGLWSTSTSGNIAIASTAVVSKALTMCYDNGTSKWYPNY